MGSLADLAGSNGVPLSDIGRNRYVPPPQADINGPIDEQALAYYLARMGPVYPPLNFPINQEALATFPESQNVEDRRGLYRRFFPVRR